MDRNAYDSFEHEPEVTVDDHTRRAWSGWTDITERLSQSIRRQPGDRVVVAVDCYPGVYVDEVAQTLQTTLKPELLSRSEDAFHSPDEIDERVEPFLGGDDPIFGYRSNLTIESFFDPDRLKAVEREIRQQERGLVLLVGPGATCLHEPDLLVYADMARWEIQQRQRKDEIGNLGVDNPERDTSLQYKRCFFVDWRVADRHKQQILTDAEFLLDTNDPDLPKMITGNALCDGLNHTTQRPFSLVPFFDPGVWGGEWMRETFNLDEEPPNFAWCFNCVPEENSLLLRYGDVRVEIPAIDLVFFKPVDLMGEHVYSLFGPEFPIRFDYLDTMEGQNLSLQVHPLMNQIQDEFGMHYTQDESYYLMDAGEEGTVYLGLKEDVDPDEMLRHLERARDVEGETFDAEPFVNQFPVDKHDHVSIPAGTIHCSGEDSMVLEISATPYIFTFKLWDWDRVGLDGEPRPINVERAKRSIQWHRQTNWVQEQLINRVEPVDEGAEWTEERTGLHELEFIETRRHWFSGPVPHDTEGTVHVLNLVEGQQAVVESPGDAFDPFTVHYGETFIIPAAVGPYTIRPEGPSEGTECATIKAYVR